MTSRRDYLVSYDISDPVRLRRVHRTVRDFGDALQLSVFWCQLSSKDRAHLEARLRDIANLDHDQILFFDLGATRREEDGPPVALRVGRKITPGIVRVIIV